MEGTGGGDWRAKVLARVREIMRDADAEIVEERKWAKRTSPGIPVFSRGGIVCTGETYKSVVKLTFAKGAALKDARGLFNSSLEGKVRRAIDIREGESIDEAGLKNLIRSAVALNLKGKEEGGKKKAKSRPKPKAKPKPKPKGGTRTKTRRASGRQAGQALLDGVLD
jgi:hypothetical protein